jgi:hypothetical protein
MATFLASLASSQPAMVNNTHASVAMVNKVEGAGLKFFTRRL